MSGRPQVAADPEELSYVPKWPLGTDDAAAVRAAAIHVPESVGML